MKEGIEMVDLKGTEKQIKYAEDIKAEIMRLVNTAREVNNTPWSVKNNTPEYYERCSRNLQKIEDMMNNIESAKEIIENYQGILINSVDSYDKYSYMCTKFRDCGLTPFNYLKNQHRG